MRAFTTWFWVLLIAWSTTIAARAGADSASFDQANRLYEQGKYADAIVAYRGLLGQKQASAALYFNLGNAFFKSGNTGEAIINYRLAQRLAPRDPDILANLRFARESAGGAASRRPWERLADVLSTNEIAVVAAVLVWAWLLVLTAGQLRPAWVPAVRLYRTPLGLMAVGAVLWLVFVVETRVAASAAVVTAREAIVRYGPFDEAQSFYTLRDGAEVNVLDRKDNWLQVSDRSRRTGWLQVKDVTVLPPG